MGLGAGSGGEEDMVRGRPLIRRHWKLKCPVSRIGEQVLRSRSENVAMIAILGNELRKELHV